jgi:hypothetical protein
MIASREESKRLLNEGMCYNGYAATPGAMDLADGQRDAERVMISTNKRTGLKQFSVCAPWLLNGVFSTEAR